MLLWFWQDSSQCTATGHCTVENKDKPLVLKELRKLWTKEEPGLPWNKGDFSPSNTLLVDDSPYKALRNPVLPSPYFLLPVTVTPGTKFILCNSHAVFFSCLYIVLLCSHTLPSFLTPTAIRMSRMIHWVSFTNHHHKKLLCTYKVHRNC